MRESVQKLVVWLLPVILLSACIDRFAVQPESGLEARLPPDAEITHAGTMLASGRVVGVSDGDTLTVLASNQRQYKIRLQGIDSPEKKQAFGQKCKESLMMLSANLPAQVEAYKLDRYGRIIGKVTVEGRDVALEQLNKGCAWHYKAYANEQSVADREAYAAAEKQARQHRRGLWRAKRPQAPWDYRRQYRH